VDVGLARVTYITYITVRGCRSSAHDSLGGARHYCVAKDMPEDINLFTKALLTYLAKGMPEDTMDEETGLPP
jgi:hypothetical protein